MTFDGKRVWENQEVLDHLCFSRELSAMTGSNANPIKVKEYLRIASTYFPHWDKQMAARLIEEFNLDVKKRIGKLSKGMMSMVTIIVALASKADFTILDEPVAGLDVVARERFYQILVDEFTETGRTFVISTHIIEEAADIFEEVIIVDKGEILLKENTQELLERAYHLSGHENEVDAATISLKTYHEEHMGRSKGVTVLLEPGQRITDKYDVSIQRLSLQKVFVALCGRRHTMSEWKRNVKFWSRNLLENLGLIVVISFGIMVFLGLETSPETAEGDGEIWLLPVCGSILII